MKKAKRIKFKFFKNEDQAWEYIKFRKKNFPKRAGYSYFYNAMQYKHKKSDKKRWLAYCLMRKLKGR
jgi:hypothetical protein